LGHYSMKGTLVVDTPQDYEAWLKERAELSAASQGGAAQPAPSQSPGAAPPRNNPPQPLTSPTPGA